jgi:hypothetical protein
MKIYENVNGGKKFPHFFGGGGIFPIFTEKILFEANDYDFQTTLHTIEISL